MKTQVLATLVALLVTVSAGQRAAAQASTSVNASKLGVAVIDINYIFNEYQKHKGEMDAMKADFRAIDTQLKTEQQKIMQAEQQKAESFKPGSPEFNQLDDQIVKMKADLQVQVTRQRKDLVEREASIYYTTYREVDQAIKYYAKNKGITLVLRFNGDEADPNNRESILRSINKAVHYQDQIDITPDVLALLNRAASQQANRGTAPR
ncbi:OmpH family outer membrane protein [Botrimarina hoheduenensis]|uniref:Outer membrane protein (OmpH-like) n=1 Tax=Botrimarina hoheduenensis TaxID=2528000 RepID=A0A5C5WEX3_9BACT|nr:OmpH family outer membrane protein [Botrimarina hoheduenensis]TWT48631.1 Outer membrane protein (OmpH-like) [Botrimarina hoheduenensis]